ncbi:hypothetical protein AHF37_04538 [Paragonimus kellicotti]|nr:hypothetical protein AHF37_04538 [Paragonimus kellicotti]
MTFLTNYLVRHGIRIIDFYRLIDFKQSGLMSRSDFVAGVLENIAQLYGNHPSNLEVKSVRHSVIICNVFKQTVPIPNFGERSTTCASSRVFQTSVGSASNVYSANRIKRYR